MSNPHDLSASADPAARVREFARDLAYGALEGFWQPDFGFSLFSNGNSRWHLTMPDANLVDNPFNRLVDKKWPNGTPGAPLLMSFGYLSSYVNDRGTTKYLLTDAAFKLLDARLEDPTIFISYRRTESSAFALLLEARLKIAGNPNPFVDKNIKGGEDWHGVLKERIEKSEWFICLVGESTLGSDWVQREIAWADAASCKILAVCQPGIRLEDCPAALKKFHGYEINEETALQYEAAVNFVLNSLGYTTY